MKTLKITLLAFLALVALACNPEENIENSKEALSNEEAAEMIASAISTASGGFNAIAEQAATATNEAIIASQGGRILACAYSESETIIKSNPEGSSYTFNCTFNYSYVLTCQSGIPNSLAIELDYDGAFNGSKLSTAHQGEAGLTVTGLNPLTNDYIISGDYSRIGSFTSKGEHQNNGNSTIELSLVELTVDKVNKRITAGAATVSIKGSVASKGDFELNASVQFQGNASATITINGTNYDVNLAAGSIN